MDELRAHQLAAAAGFAPRILAAHGLGHWLLMELVDEPVWTAAELHSDTGAVVLGSQLARLHELPVPAGLPPVDAPAMADAYLLSLRQVDAPGAAQLVPVRDRIAALGERLLQFGMVPVLNHGDLVVSNLLGRAPLLVDWEYAQVAEPGWDLACLLTYYPAMSRFLPQLLPRAGMPPGAASAVLELQLERFALLNHLWERLAAHEAG
jgi:aminoglycoside phosphotransferase (APT) family kinase protein